MQIPDQVVKIIPGLLESKGNNNKIIAQFAEY
jgi:hypothetical protein